MKKKAKREAWAIGRFFGYWDGYQKGCRKGRRDVLCLVLLIQTVNITLTLLLLVP